MPSPYDDVLCVGAPRLTFKYKLYCDANYYSSDCSVSCVASDTDDGGHHTCDPDTGNIICLPGVQTFLCIFVSEFHFKKTYDDEYDDDDDDEKNLTCSLKTDD